MIVGCSGMISVGVNMIVAMLVTVFMGVYHAVVLVRMGVTMNVLVFMEQRHGIGNDKISSDTHDCEGNKEYRRESIAE